MIGYPEAKARGRWERHRARAVFERLDADSVIERAPDGKRFRIFACHPPTVPRMMRARAPDSP